jgi:hypothetical protein
MSIYTYICLALLNILEWTPITLDFPFLFLQQGFFLTEFNKMLRLTSICYLIFVRFLFYIGCWLRGEYFV